MAKKIEKAVKAQANVPVTGLGETIEQINSLVDELARALIEHVPAVKKMRPEDRQAFFQAAYQFGLAERRRRKLARKVNGSGKDEA